jgi:hypothetical protein
MPTEHREIRLVLCIDLDADPITGSLTSAGGATRRFSGWIALTAALTAIRAQTAQQPGVDHRRIRSRPRGEAGPHWDTVAGIQAGDRRPPMQTAQQQPTHDGTTIEDLEAIAAVVGLYVDGCAQGDAAKLAEAFHPDAQMYGAIGDQRFDVPVTEFCKIVAAAPGNAGGQLRAQVSSIAQVGDAATAVVIEEGFWGSLSFVDFFSLSRCDGRWRIVNKTFAHTGGEMP